MVVKDYDYYFFDLFHTLVLLEPNPVTEENEFAILGISRSEWTRAAQMDYRKRAIGEIRDLAEIAASIVRFTGAAADERKLDRIVDARKERYRRTFSVIRPSVLETLKALRAAGKELILVSNADAFDSLYWDVSPLAPLFGAAIFSWEVGCVKPERRIYDLAMESVAADPARSVFIGDGGNDELAGAKAAGLATVLTTELIAGLWPESIPTLALNADYVVNTLTELTA